MSENIIHNILYSPILRSASMDTDQVGTPIGIQSITCYAVHAFWTGFGGDAGALITMYGSNDGVNFTAVSSTNPTGTSGSVLLNVEKAGYRFVRVDYTQTTTPAGSISINISGKVI